MFLLGALYVAVIALLIAANVQLGVVLVIAVDRACSRSTASPTSIALYAHARQDRDARAGA